MIPWSTGPRTSTPFDLQPRGPFVDARRSSRPPSRSGGTWRTPGWESALGGGQLGRLEEGDRRTVGHPEERVEVRDRLAGRRDLVVEHGGDEFHAEQPRVEVGRRRRVAADERSVAEHRGAAGQPDLTGLDLVLGCGHALHGTTHNISEPCRPGPVITGCRPPAAAPRRRGSSRWERPWRRCGSCT